MFFVRLFVVVVLLCYVTLASCGVLHKSVLFIRTLYSVRIYFGSSVASVERKNVNVVTVLYSMLSLHVSYISFVAPVLN